MRYLMRTRSCSQCGAELTGHLPPTKRVLCIDCAMTRSAEAARQLHERSGPYYERWRAGMAAAAARHPARPPSPPPGG